MAEPGDPIKTRDAAPAGQRDRFQQVVEGAPSAMVMVDATGCIELFNAQAERMFGYRRSDVIGKSVEY